MPVKIDWMAVDAEPNIEKKLAIIENCRNGKPAREKIGFFDIETTGLKADFSFMYSYAIKAYGENKIYGRVLTSREVRTAHSDKKLLQEMCVDLRRFDRIVTQYGQRFDVPYTRSRCLKFNIAYPIYREIMHTDIYFISRNRLKISRNSLANVCRFLGISAKTHPLLEDKWELARIGDERALKWIWKHNVEDVISTEKAYDRLKAYASQTRTSI